MIKNQPPDVVFLGTSRCAYSLDPENEIFYGKKTFNSCFGGASMYEVLRFLQHAYFHNNKVEVVLNLDFLMFNNNVNPKGAGYKESFMSVDVNNFPNDGDSPYKLIFSFGMFIDSLKTILYQSDNETHHDNGLKNQNFILDSMKRAKPEFFFERVEKNYFNKYYENFSFDSKFGNSLDFYEDFLDFSYQRGMNLKLNILPTHARLKEVMYKKGLNKKYIFWKKKLIELNEKIAKKYSKNEYKLWDFSGYNSISTQKVHESISKNYFWESSHFKKKIGDKVLDSLYSNDNFSEIGYAIDSKNIDRHIENEANNRQNWLNMHGQNKITNQDSN